MKSCRSSLFFCLTLVVIMLSACSHSAEDELKKLLQTVPADASAVGVFNLETLGDKLEKHHAQKDSLKSMLANVIGARSVSAQNSVKDLIDGKAGIKQGSLVYFESAHQYLTGIIENEAEFKAFVEKYSGATFSKEGAFQVVGNAAFTGNQFWLQTQGSIDVEELTSLTRLTKTQSILSAACADDFVDLDHDFRMIASFTRYLQSSGRNSLEMNLLSAALFDDAAYVGVEFDLTGNKKSPLGCELKAEVLNTKFKPAKFLLPTKEIDVEAVKKMDGRGTGIIALAVSPKMINKVAKMAASFGGSLPADLLDAMKCLDGTIAVSGDGNNLQGFISAKKGESDKLQKYLTNYTDIPFIGAAFQGVAPIKFSTVDNQVRFSQGILPAGTEVTSVAPQFKDAMFAFWTNNFDYGDYLKGANVPFNGSLLFTISPENGSLVAKVVIK